jgi:hypothetical protein
MSLSKENAKEFAKELVIKVLGQGKHEIQQTLDDYNKKFDQLQAEAQSRYKNADKWGLIHIMLGSLGSLSSGLSIFFTFYHNAQITVVFSGISLISITTNTFLNPSKRERELLEIKRLCDFIEIDFSFIKPLIADKKSSDLSKQIALENLGRSLKELSEKLNKGA